MPSVMSYYGFIYLTANAVPGKAVPPSFQPLFRTSAAGPRFFKREHLDLLVVLQKTSTGLMEVHSEM